ncbi:MAG: ribosome-associated translation inhibitor RaiA [Chloroflexi bacterium]|nr:ribosome-associated translation inhibitor RaiA [Chloroflexota bacterium]
MTNKVVIKGHGIGVWDKVRDYVEKKVSKLDHYLSEINEVRVDLSVEKKARDADDRQVVQLTVPLRGAILRTEERAADMYTGIDEAVEKMHRQIERYKAKRRHTRADAAEMKTAMEPEPELAADIEAAPGPQIVRRKSFPVTPMTEAEAIEQMALLQHDNFFIFFNADTAKMNVLYTRKDGNLGLIEPDLA